MLSLASVYGRTEATKAEALAASAAGAPPPSGRTAFNEFVILLMGQPKYETSLLVTIVRPVPTPPSDNLMARALKDVLSTNPRMIQVGWG